MRFVLVKGQSQYGSLRLHVDQLAAALTERGQAVEIVDVTLPEAAARLMRACAGPTDCVFGFSGVGSDIAVAGRFFERPAFAYASLYVDHPVHHLERLSTRIERNAAFFLDRTHVEFVRLWAQPDSFAHIGFLPPGANRLAQPVDTGEAAFAARDIPLLFTGTYRGAPAEAWAEWPAGPARTLVADAAGRMAADGRVGLLDALGQALGAGGAALSADLLRQAAPLLLAIQLYAEAHHRHRVLTALGQDGAEVSVYGAGWEPLCETYPSFRFGGVGEFAGTLGLLRRARLVLNINNGFVSGGHERVFTALAAGAAVLTDASAYYDEAFRPGQDLSVYDINQPEALAGRIDQLAADPAGLAALARSGHETALANHLWRHRAGELVAAVEAIA